MIIEDLRNVYVGIIGKIKIKETLDLNLGYIFFLKPRIYIMWRSIANLKYSAVHHLLYIAYVTWVHFGELLHGTLRKAENNTKTDTKIIIFEITTCAEMT
jgi:hypothetical protein